MWLKREFGILNLDRVRYAKEEQQFEFLQNKLQVLYDTELRPDDFQKLDKAEIQNIILLLQHGFFYFEFCNDRLKRREIEIDQKQSALNAKLRKLEKKLLASKSKIKELQGQATLERQAVKQIQVTIKQFDFHECFYCQKHFKNTADWMSHMKSSHDEACKEPDETKMFFMAANMSLQQQMAALAQNEQVARENQLQIQFVERQKRELEERLKNKNEVKKKISQDILEVKQYFKDQTKLLQQETEERLLQKVMDKQQQLLELKLKYEKQLEDIENSQLAVQKAKQKRNKSFRLVGQYNETDLAKAANLAEQRSSLSRSIRQSINIEEHPEENLASPTKSPSRKSPSKFSQKGQTQLPPVDSPQISLSESNIEREFIKEREKKLAVYREQLNKFMQLRLQIINDRSLNRHINREMEGSKELQTSINDVVDLRIGIDLEEAEKDELEFYLEELKEYNKNFRKIQYFKEKKLEDEIRNIKLKLNEDVEDLMVSEDKSSTTSQEESEKRDILHINLAQSTSMNELPRFPFQQKSGADTLKVGIGKHQAKPQRKFKIQLDVDVLQQQDEGKAVEAIKSVKGYGAASFMDIF